MTREHSDDFMQAFSRWITVVALLVTVMLTVQWSIISPKCLALQPTFVFLEYM